MLLDSVAVGLQNDAGIECLQTDIAGFLQTPCTCLLSCRSAFEPGAELAGRGQKGDRNGPLATDLRRPRRPAEAGASVHFSDLPTLRRCGLTSVWPSVP